MTDTVKVDLNEFSKTGQVHNLVGYELGQEARGKLRIEELESSHDAIEVNVPRHIYFLSPTFFNGMFLESMKQVDSGPEFFNKFRFRCSRNVAEQILVAAERHYKSTGADRGFRQNWMDAQIDDGRTAAAP